MIVKITNPAVRIPRRRNGFRYESTTATAAAASDSRTGVRTRSQITDGRAAR